MRRREFIAGFGATTAWPLVARAQQKSMPVIGYLNVGFPQLQHPFVVAFHEGLKETAVSSRVKIWLSNTVGRRNAMIGCPQIGTSFLLSMMTPERSGE